MAHVMFILPIVSNVTPAIGAKVAKTLAVRETVAVMVRVLNTLAHVMFARVGGVSGGDCLTPSRNHTSV